MLFGSQNEISKHIDPHDVILPPIDLSSFFIPYIAISGYCTMETFIFPPHKPLYSLGRFGLSLFYPFFFFATMNYLSSTYHTLGAVALTFSFLVGGIANFMLFPYTLGDLDLWFTSQTLLLGGCEGVNGICYIIK